MINFKIKQNLDGDEHWPGLAWVLVKGDKSEKPFPAGASQVMAEEIVQSWQQIAVLEVTPDIDVYFGFMTDGPAYFLNVPVQRKNGRFGVHLGDGDVRFFVIPKDLKARPELKLVDVVSVSDPAYADLPLY